MICVGLIIYIIVDRSGRPRAGDRGVEITILVALYGAIFYVIYFWILLTFSRSERFTHLAFIALSSTGFYFGAVTLIAAVVATARRAIYVDSGVVTLSLVLIPGALSRAIFSLQFIPKESVSTEDGLPAVEAGSGLDTRGNGILT